MYLSTVDQKQASRNLSTSSGGTNTALPTSRHILSEYLFRKGRTQAPEIVTQMLIFSLRTLLPGCSIWLGIVIPLVTEYMSKSHFTKKDRGLYLIILPVIRQYVLGCRCPKACFGTLRSTFTY